MRTIVYVIGVVMKGDSVLMRKKPDGAGPYKESWYLFGSEIDGDNRNPDAALKNRVKKMTGLDIKVAERLTWDVEVKPDPDGVEAFFVYLDVKCEYLSGEFKPAEGIEKLEWIPIKNLADYDLVPPSRKLVQRLGWLE